MKKTILVIGLMLVVLAQLVAADVIDPNYKSLSITNKIMNINDFPDYIFISGPTSVEHSPGLGMCHVNVVESDGIIDNTSYKFCDISVFAVKKTAFNQEDIDRFNNFDEDGYEQIEAEYSNFIKSDSVIEVIKDVEIYRTISITSSQDEITNEYTIGSNLVNTSKNRIVHRSKLIYFYLIIPFIVLIIILLIIAFRIKKR